MKRLSTRHRPSRAILAGALTVAFVLALALAGGVGRASIAVSNASAAVYQYGSEWSITQIGGPFTSALAINDSGFVAGTTGQYPAQDAAVWDPSGSLTVLTTPSGFDGGYAQAIDGGGQLGGGISSGFSEAVVWNADGTIAQRLGFPPDGGFSSIHDMNDAGQAVGVAHVGGNYRAFLWEAGEWEILNSHEGFTVAYAINEVGDVVGSSQGADWTESYAVLWRNGEMIDLPVLDGGLSAYALDINDAGQIVGTSNTAAEPNIRHAVLWDDGEIIDLGTLGGYNAGAQGINESGQIVGWMQDTSGVMHAFVWEDGAQTELGLLSGDTNAQALDVNEEGVIAGVSQTAAPSWEGHAVTWTRVTDTTPPEITVPDDMSVNATSPAGAPVEFAVTAWDEIDGAVPVNCDPASGSQFPIGDATVNCEATDAAGNTATANFTVTVKGAPEQLSDLRDAVEGIGPGTSLADKVSEAQAALANDDAIEACEILNAFINQVEAQSGKKIDTPVANALIADATRIRAVLGCST